MGGKNPETDVRIWTENDSRLRQMGVLGKEVTGLASGCDVEEKAGGGRMRNRGQCPGSA